MFPFYPFFLMILFVCMSFWAVILIVVLVVNLFCIGSDIYSRSIEDEFRQTSDHRHK
jgi:uncharacterized membrane protein